jgi:hypothetical protein
VKIDHDLPDEQLAGGLQLTVPSRANTLDDRIKEGAGTIPLVPSAAICAPGLVGHRIPVVLVGGK